MPISEIEIGDTVIAYDEATGITGEYTVTDIISHEDEALAYVTINGEEIETTPWHLFYTSEGWVEAEDLQEGDSIISLGGVFGTVESVIIVDAVQTMYDLTVEEVHNFAVGEGDWVVHNCNFSPNVQAFIDQYKLPRGQAQGIKTAANELGGAFEQQYMHLPTMTSSDLTEDHIIGLLNNTAGHIDITIRNFIRRVEEGDVDRMNSALEELLKQLSLGRYRFLNHPDPRLVQARQIELEALNHPGIPDMIRQQLLETINTTLSWYR